MHLKCDLLWKNKQKNIIEVKILVGKIRKKKRNDLTLKIFRKKERKTLWTKTTAK